MPLYHGTSTSVGITDTLLPPSRSAVLSESGRKRNLDKVFFTADRASAAIYARKAVKRFGGLPVVYEVAPIGDAVTIQATPGTTVFMADGATILRIL